MSKRRGKRRESKRRVKSKEKAPATASAKRKEARAYAVLRPGKGKLYVNGFPIEVYAENELLRMRVLEPLLLVPEHTRSVDVRVSVKGGGFMSRAEAARMAVAKAMVKWTGSESLKRVYDEYDRNLLSGDFRRKEPKKFGGKGARARFQKSYR